MSSFKIHEESLPEYPWGDFSYLRLISSRSRKPRLPDKYSERINGSQSIDYPTVKESVQKFMVIFKSTFTRLPPFTLEIQTICLWDTARHALYSQGGFKELFSQDDIDDKFAALHGLNREEAVLLRKRISMESIVYLSEHRMLKSVNEYKSLKAIFDQIEKMRYSITYYRFKVVLDRLVNPDYSYDDVEEVRKFAGTPNVAILNFFHRFDNQLAVFRRYPLFTVTERDVFLDFISHAYNDLASRRHPKYRFTYYRLVSAIKMDSRT